MKNFLYQRTRKIHLIKFFKIKIPELDTNMEEIMKFKNIDSNLEELMDKDNKQIELNIKYRQIVFMLISIIYCISSCDEGIVLSKIRIFNIILKIQINQELVFFSFAGFIGRIIWAIVISPLIDIINI